MIIHKLNDFRVARKFRLFNRIAQALLGLTLLLGINIVTNHLFIRHDLTATSQYTLSAESKACIRALKQPVEVILTIPENPEAPELKEIQLLLSKLLREYTLFSQQSGDSKLTVEHLDYYRQTSRALAIDKAYSITKNTVALLIMEERAIKITPADLFQIKDQAIVGFRGEQAITSGIVRLMKLAPEKIYFLMGHGEMSINQIDLNRGLSELKITLLENHYQVSELDLSTQKSVPEDADLIIIAAPQGALLASEQSEIRRFMSARNGSLIVLIDPGRRHGLQELFYDWGIMAEDLVVIEASTENTIESGEHVIRHFSAHPITKNLSDFNLSPLWGPPRPIRMDPAAVNKPHIKVVELLASSKTSWAERDYRYNQPSAHEFDSTRDLKGPVSIATTSERNAGSKMGLQISGGRMVVFGNSDFISNQSSAVYANQQLILQATHWVLQNTQSLNIPAKKFTDHQLVMSQSDLKKLLFYFMLPPLSVLFIGLCIAVIRKK